MFLFFPFSPLPESITLLIQLPHTQYRADWSICRVNCWCRAVNCATIKRLSGSMWCYGVCCCCNGISGGCRTCTSSPSCAVDSNCFRVASLYVAQTVIESDKGGQCERENERHSSTLWKSPSSRSLRQQRCQPPIQTGKINGTKYQNEIKQ